MLIQFAQTKPRVVGDVDQEIGAVAAESTRKLGIRVFVADEDAEAGRLVAMLRLENGLPSAGIEVGVESYEIHQEGERVPKRNEFAEGNEVGLVITIDIV